MAPEGHAASQWGTFAETRKLGRTDVAGHGGKNSRVALIPVPQGDAQRGMHPISTGR